MSSKPSEPHNPFYLLLLLASLLFVVTALAYVFVPMLEEKASTGAEAPQSPFRSALRQNGWKWLLYEVGAMVVLGLASMWLDRVRLRRLQKKPTPDTMPAATVDIPSPSTFTVSHEERGPTDRGPPQADKSP